MQATWRKILTRTAILVVEIVHNLLDVIMLPSCRFSPSCSTYAIEAIKKHGAIAGLFQGLKRIVRCHPGAVGGYDPVK